MVQKFDGYVGKTYCQLHATAIVFYSTELCFIAHVHRFLLKLGKVLRIERQNGCYI